MTNASDVDPGKTKDNRQGWVQYLLGGVGTAWLIGWIGRTYWMISSSLSLLGKGIWLTILLCTLLFALNLFWPSRGQLTDVEDMWAFVRGPKPQDRMLRSEWWRLRRHLALIVTWLALWACYGLAATLGLAKA